MRTPLPPPANPGAAGTAVFYDSGEVRPAHLTLSATRAQRVRVGVYTDVADALFKVDWYAPGSSTPRSVASVAIGAAAFFQRDVLLQPGRTRIYIASTTAPTTWEVGAEVVDDQALGQ